MKHQEVGGWLDSLFADLLKNAIDINKMDKPRVKSGLSTIIDGMKPATKLPGDFDDSMWDMLKDAANKLIDQIGVQDTGPITVGSDSPYMESSRNFTAKQTNAFLATCKCSEDRKERVRNGKRIMKTLYATDKATGNEVFTDDERRKVVGAFPFLLLLQLFGPLIIDLIKKWLSK